MSGAVRSFADFRPCPLTSPTPHGGGIAIGVPRGVMIDQCFPAVCITDVVLCVGPADFCVQGSASTRVGGLAVVRAQVDKTAHNTTFPTGSTTVKIGGKSVPDFKDGFNQVQIPLPDNIKLDDKDGIAAYQAKLREHYFEKEGEEYQGAKYNPSGIIVRGPKEYRERTKEVLGSLEASGRMDPVFKKFHDKWESASKGQGQETDRWPGVAIEPNTKDIPWNAGLYTSDPDKESWAGDPSKGVGETIHFSPEAYGPKGGALPGPPPMNAEVALGHEMIHAYHSSQGCNCYANGQGGTVEEHKTIGLGKYAKEKPSENDLREYYKLPKRTSDGWPNPGAKCQCGSGKPYTQCHGKV